MINAKNSLKIPYPPPYERELWHYQQSKTDHIKRKFEQKKLESWGRPFKNLNTNEMAFFYNGAFKSVPSKHFPHEKLVQWALVQR